jgi:phage terminase small subunit
VPASETKKRIETQAFAQAYLDHGMNATQATLAIKPQVSPESARSMGSELLARASESGAIDSIMSGAKAQWESIARDCMNQLHKCALGESSAIAPDLAHKLLIEYGKIFASPANAGPKSLTQINKYTIPKR